MPEQGVQLSLIVPVYNSAGFIAQSLMRLDAFLRELSFGADLIIVDDGSFDESRALIDAWLKMERPYSARLISYGTNRGKGGAVAEGMLTAKGEYRIFLDADLAYEPSQTLRILEVLKAETDVAVACRVHPQSRYTISPAFFNYLYTRHLASRLINWAMRRTILPRCSDSQAGLKGFRAQAAEEIFSRQRIKGFSFDIEALYLAEKMAMRIKEVPVDFKYESEPTTVVFMQDGLGIARDILKVRLGAAMGRYRLPPPDMRKRLIVNADDYGMTLGISRGILKCAEAGFVLSTSAMTNAPDFEASMEELKGAAVKPEVGLHAVLTWGRPLSDPARIRTLVDSDGNFHSRGRLLLRSLAGLISEEEVAIELRAQCEKLSRLHPEIAHINGHHHVHAFPTICRAAARVATEFKIPWVRASCEGMWMPLTSAFVRRSAIALLKGARPFFWRSHGFLCPDRFGGFSLGAGPDLKQRWLDTIARLKPGITEIMVHPGYPSDCHDIYNEGRQDEVEVLTDASLMEGVKASGVQLLSRI
jgi:dolichyl-phosphate beta-glucosyltransferase